MYYQDNGRLLPVGSVVTGLPVRALVVWFRAFLLAREHYRVDPFTAAWDCARADEERARARAMCRLKVTGKGSVGIMYRRYLQEDSFGFLFGHGLEDRMAFLSWVGRRCSRLGIRNSSSSNELSLKKLCYETAEDILSSGKAGDPRVTDIPFVDNYLGTRRAGK